MRKLNIRVNLSLRTLLCLRLGLNRKFTRRFNPGDIVYIRYFLLEKKKKKYFIRLKEFFGKCIAYRNRLFKSSVILRKAVKLNEVEQLFVLDSPFIVGVRVQRASKRNLKKLLFLRRYSGKYSRVRLLAGFKRKVE